jgi:hypothetical protein
MNILSVLIADVAKTSSEQKDKLALEKSSELGITVEQWRAREEDRLAKMKILLLEQESGERLRKQACEKVENDFRRKFGNDIGIGASAHVGRIMKLSGLCEKSFGDGWSKGTVWHLVVDDKLCLGKLRRDAGDLLCRPRSSLGRRTMGITGTAETDELYDATWHGQAVTCPQCLAIMARLR